jgi:hypothetical protein
MMAAVLYCGISYLMLGQVALQWLYLHRGILLEEYLAHVQFHCSGLPAGGGLIARYQDSIHCALCSKGTVP